MHNLSGTHWVCVPSVYTCVCIQNAYSYRHKHKCVRNGAHLVAKRDKSNSLVRVGGREGV